MSDETSERRAELERLVAQLRATADALDREIARLHSNQRAIIVPNMQGATQPATSPSPRQRRARRGRPTVTDHAFPRALEALVPPLDIAKWARKHRLKRGRVKSWFADGDAGRQISRSWADKIEAEFYDEATKTSAVPATLATWKNGIREGE